MKIEEAKQNAKQQQQQQLHQLIPFSSIVQCVVCLHMQLDNWHFFFASLDCTSHQRVIGLVLDALITK